MRFFLDEDYAGEIFEIDLVDYAGVGGDDGEVAKASLAPAQEGIAFFVALELEEGIHVEGSAGAEFVDLHGVVDYEFDGLQRIDEGGVAAELLHGVAHGGEIDDAGDAGEILEKDAAGGEGYFFVGLGILVPAGHRTDVVFLDVAAVFGAEEIFEEDAQ